MGGNGLTILDGGMGQELRRRSDKPVTPLWSAQVMLDEPELVASVHRDFIAAGAEVITLNTYAVTPQRLERDGALEWFDPLQAGALAAAHQARVQAQCPDVRIAGCLPPLVASYHADVVPDEATCLRDYRRIVAAQAEGVDLFIAETLSLTREAHAATTAAAESGLPVWTSLTISDDDGTRLRSGERLVQAAQAAIDAGAQAVLVNCSAPEAISQALPILAAMGIKTGGYANGFQAVEALKPGGTVDALTTRDGLTPSVYAEFARQWRDQGASIIGGCCEIGPEHIAAVAKSMQRSD